MDLCIIPECYVDTNLIETLVPPQKQYNHQKGCGTVTKVMKEKFADSFSLGIIDKDKREVDYLKEFTVIVDKNPIYLHKHRTRHHYIIQVSPAMEQFMLDAAATAGISLKDFGLPDDLASLMKEAKSTTTKADTRFKNLFKTLLAAQSEPLIRLAAWIRYLKETNYKADSEKLKTI